MYADIQQSTNPPAAPPPTQPVVYADIQQSTNPPAAPPSTQPVVYAEVKQSNSPPAAASPPTEIKTVLYAVVNNPRTVDDLAIECCDHLQKVYMLVNVVISVVMEVFENKSFGLV